MTVALRMSALAAAFALSAPMAEAATVLYDGGTVGGDDFSLVSTAKGGADTLVVRYTAIDVFDIEGFSITANGLSSGSDIRNLTFDYAINGTPVASGLTFGTVNVSGGRANSTEFLPGYDRLQDGDIFSLTFFGATVRPVALTIVFDTVAVPLPAAGGALAMALLAGAAATRRRKG